VLRTEAISKAGRRKGEGLAMRGGGGCYKVLYVQVIED
jgi:hypothetical protein